MDRIDLKEISDNRKYQDIALLVDREDFQSDFEELNKEVIRMKQFYKLADFLREYKESDIINKILVKYKYPPGFYDSISSAAHNFKITDTDIKNCYFVFHMDKALDKDPPPLYTPRHGVLITMYPYLLKYRKKVILDEVAELLTLATRDLIKLPLGHPLSLDLHHNIRNMRGWYWENKNNKSTREITENYNSKFGEEDDSSKIHEVNIIDQAISAYRKLLKTVA